ncbi:loganic acid O-methyltransferase-like [Henckelia pumila]|uniref:loganic acid O-methyltransferase-like n=1 Tax=Henckelia pumila TaxID=405737 RepID=UPI003C6E1104
MAQLHAMISCYKSPRIPIKMTIISSSLNTENRVQNNLELVSSNGIRGSSTVGLYAMNGGEGPNSYAQNSSYQRGVIEVAKPILEEEIDSKFDIKNITSSTTLNSFRIADFGSSTGHNSFPAMQIITKAIEEKFKTEGGNINTASRLPDFQVFFNDQVMNDFNTLFNSLPLERQYYTAGVPGPFHGRLFPKSSLHFAYCSCALNWLSDVPEAVLDETSSAWNKARVHYTGAREQVFDAYKNQYAKDIESFLEARAEELISGGLMALLVPAVPSFTGSETTFTTPIEMDLIGSCLVDMAKKGTLSEAKVDSFNFPLYFTIPQELRAMIERNRSFSIERTEILNNPGKLSVTSSSARSTYLRAVFEGLLVNHFGSEIMDELFDRYTKKLEASPIFADPSNEKSIIIFVLLKRKFE